MPTPDQKRGLYQKYFIERVDDKRGKHFACEYYVLDWNHDRFAIPAMEVYAKACEVEYPKLAADIRAMVAKYRQQWEGRAD